MSYSQKERQEQIAERKARMPKAYRAKYVKATQGSSLRAAVNAFCLECVCWKVKEVRMCTGLACPLYAVRPHQLSQNTRDGHFADVESTNPARRGVGA